MPMENGFPANAGMISRALITNMIEAPRRSPFRGKTAAAVLQELADKEEIRELIAIYAHRVTHGHAIADLFTDDGVWTIRQLPADEVHTVEGKEELTARFGDRRDNADRPLPMLHNFVIVIDGDEATGICSNELRATEEGQSIVASGYYEDRYRREDGLWRFARRDTTFLHWVPLKRGWAEKDC
jgi:ketosteroid isomerase-like protein